MDEPTLYQRLLGDSYLLLPQPLQRFHSLAAGGTAEGRVTVEWSAGRPARLCARLLLLPKAGTDLPVRVVVEPDAQRETWLRWFGNGLMRTVQRAHRDLLAERKGPATVYFLLRADAGGITFQYHSTRMFGIPLPRFIAPHIAARAAGEEQGWRIDVRISIPMVGPIAAYHGLILPAS
ncbi:MAG TPA: DUF4166 domain-containing protein [Candidatus Kapabacteria bacterium]|nr:DUF4166 domain-containing protein [Candidatus Kapabacteria bacterium]